MQIFQATFETCWQLFLGAFSIYMVVPLRIKFQQCWFFKKTSFKCLQNQGFLAILFTTSRTVLYFTGIFMLNGKQLLNKTDKQNFPQKCLFTLRMTRVFINVWMNMVVLLLNFSWSRYKVGMNWKTVITSRSFRIEFREWLCPHFYPRLTDW